MDFRGVNQNEEAYRVLDDCYRAVTFNESRMKRDTGWSDSNYIRGRF